mmetsp:Transcript_18851/g.19102  ORF Transcript_18851/g.19102 Transcript_18851/m.19102 type:complete len:90 (+) Transcript_18851:789-1058(+)
MRSCGTLEKEEEVVLMSCNENNGSTQHQLMCKQHLDSFKSCVDKYCVTVKVENAALFGTSNPYMSRNSICSVRLKQHKTLLLTPFALCS